MILRRPTPQMVSADRALAGRSTTVLPHPQPHAVLGTDILAEPAAGEAVIYLAGGCYWGMEELLWHLPGVITTAVGFMGGYTPNPTYAEVCTGQTGHAETVRVLYRNTANTLPTILTTFWESHDPTTLNVQGNDVGTQYRSAIFPTTTEQLDLALRSRNSYEAALYAAGTGPIVTEVVPASQTRGFFPAEAEHQQYLVAVPNGYRCHARTGVACPMPSSGLHAQQAEE